MYKLGNFRSTNNIGLGQADQLHGVQRQHRLVSLPVRRHHAGTAASWASSDNNYFGSMGTTTLPGRRNVTTDLRRRRPPPKKKKPPPPLLATSTACRPIPSPTITDGTSNTVAYGEGLVGDASHWTRFRDGVAWTAAGPYYAANDAWAQQSYVLKGIAACAAMWSTKSIAVQPKSEDKGWRWGNEATGDTLFNTIIPPSSTTYPWSGCRADNSYGPVSNGEFENANSFHPGGCNVGFADGSVRFVKSSIAITTWWSLGTKANGEVISADSY